MFWFAAQAAWTKGAVKASFVPVSCAKKVKKKLPAEN